MHIQKFLSCLLALCLLLNLAGIASAEEDIELTFSAWAGATEKAALEKALASFTETTGIKVKGVFVPDEYDTKISTMIAADIAPDVGYLTAGTAYSWYGDGQLMDLAPFIAEDDTFKEEDLLDSAYSYYDSEHIDGILLSFQSSAVFYNKDLFDAAGMAYPSADEPWDWDDFVKTAKQLTIDSNGKNATEEDFDPSNIQQYGVNISVTWSSLLEPLLLRNTGISFVSEDGSEFGLKRPEAVEFIQKLADLINVEHCTPSPTTASGLPSADISLQTGKYAMSIEFHYMLQNFSQLDDLNLGIARLPGTANDVTLASSGLKVIFSQTKHPKEAWELVKWLNDPAQCLELYSSGLWMPVMADWYTDEAKIELWAAEGKAHPQGYRGSLLVPMMTNNRLNAEHTMCNYNTICNDLIMPALDKVWSGEQTAQEALDAVMPEVDKVFQGRYGK